MGKSTQIIGKTRTPAGKFLGTYIEKRPCTTSVAWPCGCPITDTAVFQMLAMFCRITTSLTERNGGRKEEEVGMQKKDSMGTRVPGFRGIMYNCLACNRICIRTGLGSIC